MNWIDVSVMVDEIRKQHNDPEVAHAMQDKMFRAVLQAIAEGRADRPEKVAREALESNAPAWYA